MKKTIKNIFYSLLIIILSPLVSCDLIPDLDDFEFNIPDQPPIDDFQVNTINDAKFELTSKVWKMTNINVSNPNPNFLDYQITFNYDNSLIATNNIDTYTGAWLVTDANLNQNVLTDLKLNLSFTTPSIFEQMSKNWTFNSIAIYSYGTEIEFLLINNGNTTTGSFFLKEIK